MHDKPISITELSNGECVGLGAVEITAIPHLSILQKRFAAIANIYTEYKEDMARLLSDVFQTYKNVNNNCHNISMDGVGIYNFMVSLRERPDKAKRIIAEGFPRK